MDLYMNKCRICMMENNIMIPIFGEDGVYRKVRDMIKDALNLILKQGDPLPRKICCKCYFKLQQACQLKADCIRSTKFLLQNFSGQRYPDAIRTVKELQSNMTILCSNTPVVQHADTRSPPYVTRDANDRVAQIRAAPVSILAPQALRPSPSTSAPNSQPMRNIFRVAPSGRLKFKLRKSQVPCGVCGKFFLSKKSASAHMHKAHSTAEVNQVVCQAFKCSICLRSFETTTGLNLHRHRNHRLPPIIHKPTQSPQASHKSALILSPPNHNDIQASESSVTHECGLCFRICKTESLLRQHIASVHKDSSKGATIPPSVATPSAVEDMETPAVMENLECSLCFQPMRNVNGLVNHLRTSHGKPSCAICLEIFATQEELNAHRQTHKPGYGEQQTETKKIMSPEVFTCNICGKSFDNATSLSRHKGYHTKMGPSWRSSDHNSNSPSSITPPATKTASIRTSLNSTNATDVPRQVFKCDICPKQFDGSLSLSRHKSCHARLGPNWVPGTSSKSPSPQKQYEASLNQEDYEPVDKKPFINEGRVVEKSAIQKLKSNATTIPFCLYCKKIFDSQSRLWDHICAVHPQDPRYRCQEPGCSRVFFSGTGFRSHQSAQRHTAPPETANSNKSVESGPSMTFQPSYAPAIGTKCHICMRKFSTSQNLKRHIKMAHKTGLALNINPAAVVHTYSRKHSRVLCRYCPKYLSSKYISEHEKMHRIRGDEISAGFGSNANSAAAQGNAENQEEELEARMEEEGDEEEQEDNPINSKLQPLNIPNSITITATTREPSGNENGEVSETYQIHRKNPRPPTCKYCGLTASSFHELRDHLDMNHPGQIYHVCDGCPEIYFDRKTLVSHNIVHTRVYHKCKFCNKTFVRLLALRGHENKCLIMQKRQQGSQDANSSTRAAYSYSCEFCSDKFHDSVSFVQHLQTHAS